MSFGDGALRALTIVDVLAQLSQDSGQEVAFDPNEVINQYAADTETLLLGSDTLSATELTNYPVNLIQDAGPVAYWRLDDPVGATSVYDSSPWNTATYPKVPGSVVGGVTFGATGAMGGSKGATFNGTSGYVNVPDGASLERAGDLSVEVWFKPAGLALAQTLVTKGNAAEYHAQVGSDGSVTWGQSFLSRTVVPAGSVVAGNWHHLVVTRRAIDKTINAYLNGAQTYSGTYSVAVTATTNPVRLGANSPSAASYFGGVLDEVAIYALPLTAAQVAAHYQWGRAADCGSAPYNTVRYGYAAYPVPGKPAGAVYGDPTTTYGGATYV